MAITVTDRGTFQTAAGGAITYSATSASFTAAAGSILVVGITINADNNTGGSTSISFGASDTIADTGGGSWGERAACNLGSVIAGHYNEAAVLWTRVIGTTPGASKTVTVTATRTVGGGNTTDDGWFAGHLWEVAGQHATPIGLTASPSPATSVTTFNTDLGSTPAATSAVFSAFHLDNDTGTTDPVQPSGWTESDQQHPGWGAFSNWAYKIGSVVQSPQWSGVSSGASNRVLASAVEIVAAASAGFVAGPPLVISQAVPTAANW